MFFYIFVKELNQTKSNGKIKMDGYSNVYIRIYIKIEHLPGASVALVLAGLLGIIYCANRVIKG